MFTDDKTVNDVWSPVVFVMANATVIMVPGGEGSVSRV